MKGWKGQRVKHILITIVIFAITIFILFGFPYIVYYVYQFTHKIICDKDLYESITPDKYISLIETIISCFIMANLSFFTYRISKQNVQINKEKHEVQNILWATDILAELERQTKMFIKFYNDLGEIDKNWTDIREGIISLYQCGYLTDEEKNYLENYSKKIFRLFRLRGEESRELHIPKEKVKEFLKDIYVDYDDVASDYNEKFEAIIKKLKMISKGGEKKDA